jgi:hypothetical protein
MHLECGRSASVRRDLPVRRAPPLSRRAHRLQLARQPRTARHGRSVAAFHEVGLTAHAAARSCELDELPRCLHRAAIIEVRQSSPHVRLRVAGAVPAVVAIELASRRFETREQPVDLGARGGRNRRRGA